MSDYMVLALAEARKGLGRTSPNPAVGAVVVRKGQIVGRGYHVQAGAPHAEVVALKKAGTQARNADLYVTLEPCDHQGRTPPCTDAILNAGVARVFVGSRDPLRRGVERLRRAGLQVQVGIAEKACDRFNAPWLHFASTGRPFVTLKAAITLDGKIATASGASRWVSGEAARRWVHELRGQVDAVVVGSRTVGADNPRLTARLPGMRDPLRVVLAGRHPLSPKLNLFGLDSKAPTVIAYAAAPLPSDPGKVRWLSQRSLQRVAAQERGNVELLACRPMRGVNAVDVKDLSRSLASRGVVHLLVEGGAETFKSFLEAGLVNRLYLLVAPKLMGADGLGWLPGLGTRTVPKRPQWKIEETEFLDPDLLITLSPLALRRRRG